MRQILQNLGTGETLLAEVPAPGPRRGGLLISSRASLVSLGTEKMLVDFGKAGWIAKSRKQPDKVRQVFAKIKTDGLFPTLDAVRSKLDHPLPLGYCNAGVVVDTGGSPDFAVGDRVISNGPHAETVCVPHNLCAKIPDGVSDEAAAFAIVGAIGLQGLRLLAPTLGESVVVTGLGLIGLLTVQMLRANGCRVLGLDFDSHKCELARRFGAEALDLSTGVDPVAWASAWTGGRGVDGVLITASTGSSEPVSQAASMCRKRGRIVLVGVTGLQLNRADFFQKELSFQVSCSYGPGRYDAAYEDQGLDYPVGFVRWTEQRNFEAVLTLMGDGSLDIAPLVTHRHDIGEALTAYAALGERGAMGIVLNYPSDSEPTALVRTVPLAPAESVTTGAACPAPRLAVIGAGNFATRTLLPALRGAPVHLSTIVSVGGVTAAHAAKKFGFAAASTDTDKIIADAANDVVLITTRHNAHARQVLAALGAGKHVFVEKPLALKLAEVDAIGSAARSSDRVMMVGFNRRFAPLAVKVKSLLDGLPGPKTFVATINAGPIPAEHWTQDPEIGGGRILGEACHFIDLLRHWAGSPIIKTGVTWLGGMEGRTRDTATITMTFSDGSTGTVHYFATGDRTFPKERFEVFGGGRILQLDNFRLLRGWGWKNFSKYSVGMFSQDKGHAAGIRAFVNAITTGTPSPIPLEEILEVSRIAIELSNS
jgi:predicted dehydrogenase/NADPH:quinone reductase-like Zn-dependent oxidoreductase